MIVALPFCAKDQHLALLNLELGLKLDGGPVPFDAVISVDTNTDTTEVLALAQKYFRTVTVQTYSPWSGSPEWPGPQNWAWQATAKLLAHQKESWLWWEADAVPLKKGWLQTLQGEYDTAGKPFMGCWMNQNGMQYMNGVGVYPHRVSSYSVNSLLTRKAPFDIVLGDGISHVCHRANHLISHPLDAVSFDSLSQFQKATTKTTVLFHGCKDCTLPLLLLNRPIKTLSAIQTTADPSITVVITNWKRPDKLTEAFQSCLDAGVSKIVIASSGCDSELAKVHKSLKQQKPDIVVNAIKGDQGNNEMWLRGVRLATTPWVHILHDDDKLTPSFGRLKPSDTVGFYHWNGAKHGVPTVKGIYDTFPQLGNGVYSTDILWPYLLSKTGMTISPVGGLFRKEHLVSVLEEWEENCTSLDRFAYRPTLTVGNDLLIWLRATEKYPKFQYIKDPLISYGHWDGSCSFQDSQNGHVKLKEIYAAARDYFLRGPQINPSWVPHLIHAYSDYNDSPRVLFARQQWRKLYCAWELTPCPIPDGCLPRLFDDGFRNVPYVKDLLQYAFDQCPDANMVVLTNSDILPNPSIYRHLAQSLLHHPCAYSYRRDIKSQIALTEDQIYCNTTTYAGMDLFAISREWWLENQDKLPDLLFATEAWDYCLQQLMDRTGGQRFHYLIYHVAHEAEAIRNKNSASQQYNHSLAAPFLQSLGITPYWESATPINMNPR